MHFLFAAKTALNNKGLVPCDVGCDWTDINALINNVIHFLIFDLAMPLAACIFAYAGFLLMTSGSNPENRSKAKGLIINVFIGLAVALAAVLIVKLILSTLGFKGGSLFV